MFNSDPEKTHRPVAVSSARSSESLGPDWLDTGSGLPASAVSSGSGFGSLSCVSNLKPLSSAVMFSSGAGVSCCGSRKSRGSRMAGRSMLPRLPYLCSCVGGTPVDQTTGQTFSAPFRLLGLLHQTSSPRCRNGRSNKRLLPAEAPNLSWSFQKQLNVVLIHLVGKLSPDQLNIFTLFIHH